MSEQFQHTIVDGRIFIPDKVDRRFRDALIAGATAAGPEILAMMRTALDRKPGRHSLVETKAYYGKDLPAVIDAMTPYVLEIERGLSGFMRWLEVTGYGNDLAMVKTFVRLVQMDRAVTKLAAAAQRNFQ